MGDFKFKRFLDKTSPYYRSYYESWWFLLWNHWLNPFGNWEEGGPFPEKRAREAAESWMPELVWWHLRNFMHNFFTHWIGITPLGERYEWLLPASEGWYDFTGSWEHGPFWWSLGKSIKLKKYDGKWGWQSRGNFRLCKRYSVVLVVTLIFLGVATW